MAFSEFYCQSGGSNLNGGSDTGNAAKYTSTNGNWNGSTTFTPADTQAASLIAVGDFASVYNDGATTAVYIARVTTINQTGGNITSIVLSSSAKSGTAPTSSATGRSIKVGGAWKGPNAADAVPFGLISGAATNTTGNIPRVNMKNDATYSITSGITHANSQTVFQGYNGSIGDGGKATIDGSTNAIVILTFSNAQVGLADVIVSNNGATGTNAGITWSGTKGTAFRVVTHDTRGPGFNVTGSLVLVECEAYTTNTANTSGDCAFKLVGSTAIRCIAHDNSGSNNVGFVGSGSQCINCIADTNGSHGFQNPGGAFSAFTYCDAYNNGGDGFNITGSGAEAWVDSCNAVKNGAWGVNFASLTQVGGILNVGYGSGTQANSSGTFVAAGNIINSGSVTYASNVTPWVDPANGDFRINLAAAKGAGRGSFTETAASYTGTIGYPDIGSAQHLDAGGILINPGMSGGLR